MHSASIAKSSLAFIASRSQAIKALASYKNSILSLIVDKSERPLLVISLSDVPINWVSTL